MKSSARVSHLVILTILINLTTTVAAFGQPKAIELPKTADAPVITFDFHGGFTPPRKHQEPYLTIQANGTIRSVNPFIDAMAATDQLNKKDLQELLRFVIKKNEFFAIDSNKIKQQIEAEKRKRKNIPILADAPNSVIRVNAGGKDHTVRIYALSFQAQQFPKIAELKKLKAIEARLRNLMNRTTAGGVKGVTARLKQINAELKKRYPKAPLLRAQDLQSANRQGDGSLYVSFMRRIEPQKGFVSGAVRERAGAVPMITVQAKLP